MKPGHETEEGPHTNETHLSLPLTTRLACLHRPLAVGWNRAAELPGLGVQFARECALRRPDILLVLCDLGREVCTMGKSGVRGTDGSIDGVHDDGVGDGAEYLRMCDTSIV